MRAVTASQTSDFIFDQAGRALDTISGTTWQRGEIFAGGMHLGTYNNLVNPAMTYFEHTDWVGTARGRSNVSGSLVETCTSLPFGDNQTCANTDVSPQHFAELTWDSESNLQHALFRQYSTTQGRWSVPDPAGLAAVDATNPQTWNRYTYVGNNPTNYADPLGLYHCAIDDNGQPLNGCHEDPNDPWTQSGGDGGGSNGWSGSSGFAFGFSFTNDFCNSDFMPCGLPMPGLWQSLWSDVLGLPTGLNCPSLPGLLSPLCGGLSPAMDVTRSDCVYQAGAFAVADYFGLGNLFDPTINWGDVVRGGYGNFTQETFLDFLKSPAFAAAVRPIVKKLGVTVSEKLIAKNLAKLVGGIALLEGALTAWNTWDYYKGCIDRAQPDTY